MNSRRDDRLTGVERGRDFVSTINYELKRAERYRIFLSLVTFNIGPLIDLAGNGSLKAEAERARFLGGLHEALKGAIREVDALADPTIFKIGLLLPETSRQGAEAAARRLTETLYKFCSDYFKKPADYLVPVEIFSFPDAGGGRGITSFLEDYSARNIN